MERVSCKEFFTVLWSGLCQAVRWFFGLFGYKRDGKFAHCVWGLFAVSATVIVTIIAGALVYVLGREYYNRHRSYFCDGNDCCWRTYVSREVYLHDHGDGKVEVINIRTGKKTLTGVAWISKPLGEKDSLVVFSDGKKRGYFNKYTGDVVIPARYTRAWVFSDGIASVEEDGVVKFIDGNGRQVFNRTFALYPGEDGYVFHGNYCSIDANDDCKYGLMDRSGKTIVPEEYTEIQISNDMNYWTLTKDSISGVFDINMKPVLPMMRCASMWISDDGISVIMQDNTMRRYNLQGKIIDDFYISDFNHLEYETEDTYQTKDTYTDEDGIEHECLSEPVHKTARARLCSYVAGFGKLGLMTADGHAVTMPKYENITAVGPDTYLCEVSDCNKEIVNGKGQRVR